LIVGAYNRGLGVYLVQKTPKKGENGEGKDKISFPIGKIHGVTLHPANNV